VFEDLEFGVVDRVDMVHKTNDAGEKFKRVFVHFKTWNKGNDMVDQVIEKLLAGDQVKVVYDEPWFWKISMSKVERPNFEKKAKAPRVDFDAKPKPHPKTKAANTNNTIRDELAQMRALIQAQKDELATFKEPTTPTYTPLFVED